MSDSIKHECGIALLRLRKPLEYYQTKYGTWTYGLKRLYLLMEKQHNRGQDGAGVASLKLDPKPGTNYIHRSRSNDKSPIREVFDDIERQTKNISREKLTDATWVKENLPFAAELYLGHLRYGTHGGNSIGHVHPVIRPSNWLSRNLVLAGNFNLTNTDEIYKQLLSIGQQPLDVSDTVTMLEEIGYYLDEENIKIQNKYKNDLSKTEVSLKVAEEIDIVTVLKRASKKFDGGYAIAGLVGNGDAFVLRDPNGIRPAFYYADEETIAVASERPVLQTALNVRTDKIQEIPPGNVLIIKKDGSYTLEEVLAPLERRSCSFERIYFSRGTDKFIYRERKKLGELLTDAILKAIDFDLDNTVFSFIPNTAESAFYGMIKGVEEYMLREKQRQIIAGEGKLNEEELWEIITKRPRYEKIAVKDAKMRTFITEGDARTDMVEHVYDVTYGVVRRNEDNLVIIDDSIVRGTTLKSSILGILDRLDPKKIVVVSSCPQIRYPDCYGIDMSRMKEFCAFSAAIELLKENNLEHIIETVYKKCKEQENLPKEEIVNQVKAIYAPFTDEQISKKIAEMLKPNYVKAEIEFVFQTVENLHKACPNDLGNWYFTGDYPTPGGNKVVNKAFINYYEGSDERPY